MPVLRYRLALAFYIGASVFMLGWSVFLLLTLPSHYLAGQWKIAWTGFDLALMLLLTAMAWAIWQRRQLALLIMVVTATLLLCDAWFDITLSWGGPEEWASLLSAAGCEVPLALVMLGRARSVIVQTAAIAAPHAGMGAPSRSLHAIPLLIDGRAVGTRPGHDPGADPPDWTATTNAVEGNDVTESPEAAGTPSWLRCFWIRCSGWCTVTPSPSPPRAR